MSDKALEKGRRRVDWLRSRIAGELKSGGDGRRREFHRTLRSIDSDLAERREELFAPNVIVETDGKTAVRALPRTISAAEIEFRMIRRHGRRITGNAHVDTQVMNEGAGLLLLENLKIGAYVRAVYGSMKQLPERFPAVSSDELEKAKKILRPAGTNE